MIGERENFQQETDYGTLVMRPYNIEGNEIKAFYDSSDDLVFVLDETLSDTKPNVLLVINPDGDKKWDEILSGEYGVDLENVRPKQDNKYQKLDIEYSGLGVYEALINAYKAGDSLGDYLKQLFVLRDSAARHSAMLRLNAANEIIAKTNATIVKTKESIIRLQERLKTLRAKLSATKKEIGRVPTKQSASKVLKLESQIEAVNEKLKRARNRLVSAQRRLETATVDAELASNLLNQPTLEVKQNVTKTARKENVVQPKVVEKVKTDADNDDDEYAYIEDEENDEDLPEVKKEDNTMEDDDFYSYDTEDDDIDSETEKKTEREADNEDINEEEVKPLFDEDPNIVDEKIAFKPIDFGAETEETQKAEEIQKTQQQSYVPALNHDNSDYQVKEEVEEKMPEEKPMLESMAASRNMMIPESFKDEDEKNQVQEENKPVIDMMKPIEEDSYAVPGYQEESQLVSEDVADEYVVEQNITEPVEQGKQEEIIEETRQYEPVLTEKDRPLSPQVNVGTQNLATTPVAPVAYDNYLPEEPKKNKFLYYVLLLLLIVLSVFTLWLYQKNVTPGTPMLAAETTETTAGSTTTLQKKVKKTVKKVEKVEQVEEDEGDIFLNVSKDTAGQETVVTPEPVDEEFVPVQNEETNQEPVAPVVEDAVPAHMTTSGMSESVETETLSEDEVLARKPVYEPGGKDLGDVVGEDFESVDFVDETVQPDFVSDSQDLSQGLAPQPNFDNDDWIIDPDSLELDEEEAQYQAEQANLEYEE